MVQKDNVILIPMKMEAGYSDIAYLCRPEYESKKDHGQTIHDCHPFLTDEELKREILGTHSYT